MNWLYALSITDLGPYRAVRRSLIDRLDLREMTYGWPSELLVKAARQHARIVEVPVQYRSRRAGRSKISGTDARHIGRVGRGIQAGRRDRSRRAPPHGQ